MSDRASPIGPDYKAGLFGNLSDRPGVHLCENRFGFLGELASFSNVADVVDTLVKEKSNKVHGTTAFKIAANRWFLAGPQELQESLKAKLKPAVGSFIDLTHGRTSLRITGLKAEWVLSKLYAIDFSLDAFPVTTGLSTSHHNIFTQIYRSDELTFDLFIFRSFARSFWHTLRCAAENVGYEIS